MWWPTRRGACKPAVRTVCGLRLGPGDRFRRAPHVYARLCACGRYHANAFATPGKAGRDRPKANAGSGGDKCKWDETYAENACKARCKFPDDPDFQSVLALGYQATDSFRWHTDMAGDDGWLCSISLGATATFEYLPQIAPSARDRIEARKQLEPVSVQVGCGDCLLFHGGYLPHRITHCEAVPSEWFARSAGNSIARMNLQCRVFGASAGHGLHSLLQLAGAVPNSAGLTRDLETASSRDGDTESTVSQMV